MPTPTVTVESTDKPDMRLTEGILIAIEGFDSDPRELWEIPEVQKTFAGTLVSEGFLSILKCPELTESNVIRSESFGGLEVFLVSRGLPLNILITGALMDKYVNAIQSANQIIREGYGF